MSTSVEHMCKIENIRKCRSRVMYNKKTTSGKPDYDRTCCLYMQNVDEFSGAKLYFTQTNKVREIQKSEKTILYCL